MLAGSESVWLPGFAWSLFPVFAHNGDSFPDLKTQFYAVFPGQISFDPLMGVTGLPIRHVPLLEILYRFS